MEEKRRNFVDQIIAKKGHLIHKLKAKDTTGRWAYYFVLVEARVPALDGLRGLMTILVVISHYFAELPHGYNALAFGWIAVITFFVLSGYLVGKLILEKGNRSNFYKVFYIRRLCRTIPIYVCCVLISYALLHLFNNAEWRDADTIFPLWSYLTFTQNFFMIDTGSIGAHWLAPTWTLTVEEHFYLIAPTLIVFTPRRYLVPLLVTLMFAGLAVRSFAYYTGTPSVMFARVMLPGLLDVVIFGLLAACAITSKRIAWQKLDPWLRILPLLLLITGASLALFAPQTPLTAIVLPFLVGAGCACFILALARNVPEAKRFEAKPLCFFGTISYAVYLIHLPVLGLMHGLLLHTKPDADTPSQLLVSLAALPVCTLAAWLLTTYIEQPITRYGRSWKWSETTRR